MAIQLLLIFKWLGIKAGNLYMKLLTPHWPVTLAHVTLKTTSHTRLKARDHCILVSLIGRKDQDLPSPLHTRRWRPKGPRKPSWMKSLDKFLHNKLWRMVHDLLEHLQEIGLTHIPAHQCQLNIWYCLWMRVKVPHNYLVTALGAHVKGPYLKIPWTPRSSPTVTLAHVTLRATSHTRLKARDHCILVSLIGRKGHRDLPSPLHTRRWRPNSPRKTIINKKSR